MGRRKVEFYTQFYTILHYVKNCKIALEKKKKKQKKKKSVKANQKVLAKKKRPSLEKESLK